MLIIIYTNDFLAQDIARKVKTSVQEISGVCDTVLDFANTKHVPIIDESTATMTGIDQIEGQQAARNREGCYRLVVEEAREYNKRFSNLASSAKNPTTMKTIERELECKPPNFQTLVVYLSDLEQSLKTVEHCYYNFKKSCEDAVAAADRAASANKEMANMLKQSTSRRKRRTAVVAGVGAGAGLAAGVGLGVTVSIVAGLFTFGIGTAIGLSATAVTAAVATTGIVGGATAGAVGFAGGAAAGAATAGAVLSVNDYLQLAAAFARLTKQYILLKKTTSTMQDMLHHFHLFLKIIHQCIVD